MISYNERKILQECVFAQKLYIEGNNIHPNSKFKTFETKLVHAKSQVDCWSHQPTTIFIHPSNKNIILNIVKNNKVENLKGLKLFGMNVEFSMFVCNDDCIVADVSVPASNRSVVIFKIHNSCQKL